MKKGGKLGTLPLRTFTDSSHSERDRIEEHEKMEQKQSKSACVLDRKDVRQASWDSEQFHRAHPKKPRDLYISKFRMSRDGLQPPEESNERTSTSSIPMQKKKTVRENHSKTEQLLSSSLPTQSFMHMNIKKSPANRFQAPSDSTSLPLVKASSSLSRSQSPSTLKDAAAMVRCRSNSSDNISLVLENKFRMPVQFILRDHLHRSRLLHMKLRGTYRVDASLNALLTFITDSEPMDPLINSLSNPYILSKGHDLNNTTKSINKDLDSHAKDKTNSRMLLFCTGPISYRNDSVYLLWSALLDTMHAKELKKYFREEFTQNAVQALKSIVNVLFKLNISFKNPKNLLVATNLINPTPSTMLNYEDLTNLWRDEGIKKAHKELFRHRTDTVSYYLDSIARVHSSEFVPTNNDKLILYRQAQSILDHSCTINDIPVRFVSLDRMGIKSIKFFKNFDHTSEIVYLVDLDAPMGNLGLAYKDYVELLNCSTFRKTPVVVVMLNSIGFRDRVVNEDMSSVFSDFNGGRSLDSCLSYLNTLFLKTKTTHSSRIFVHILEGGMTKKTIGILAKTARDTSLDVLAVEGAMRPFGI